MESIFTFLLILLQGFFSKTAPMLKEIALNIMSLGLGLQYQSFHSVTLLPKASFSECSC